MRPVSICPSLGAEGVLGGRLPSRPFASTAAYLTPIPACAQLVCYELVADALSNAVEGFQRRRFLTHQALTSIFPTTPFQPPYLVHYPSASGCQPFPSGALTQLRRWAPHPSCLPSCLRLAYACATADPTQAPPFADKTSPGSGEQ